MTFRCSDDVLTIILEFFHYKHPTPLLTAVYHGYTGLITELWPGHENDVTEEGLPVLHYAAKLGREEVIRTLIECGADVNDDAGIAETPLITACTHDQCHIVKVLLEYPDIDVNRKKGGSGWFAYSALYIACDNGFVECVRALTTCDSLDINVEGGSSSPLMTAAFKGHLDILELMYRHLLSAKEPEEVASILGPGVSTHQWNPLFAACHLGHENVVHHLLDTVKVNIIANKHGVTPFMEAARMGHVGVLKIMYQMDKNDGHKRNAADTHGSTALHLACKEGHLNVVRYLIEEVQVDALTENNNGQTALDIAKGNNRTSVVSWLSRGFAFTSENL